MLTLTQVEPRTPISSVPYTITQSGAYYLTTSLTVNGGNAITIATNGVALDLNGFTISSTAPSPTGYGILIGSSLRNITIANGFIQGGVTNNGSGAYSGTGFDYGIYFTGNPPGNVLVSHVSVSGCLIIGIYVYNGAGSTLAESCTVQTIGSDGIFASTVKQSSAVDCGGDAVYGDLVFDSRGESTDAGSGITANDIVQNCYGYASGDADGVSAVNIQNCYGYSGSYIGISGTTAINCYGFSNSDHGILVENAENCFGYSSGSGYGVYAYNVASGCYGYSNTGVGLYALIASVCHGATGTGTALDPLHNVNSY